MHEYAYHIGLDFGTSQTKVCIQHFGTNPRVHEFVQFSRLDGSRSFFLPSRVALAPDQTLRFGYACELVSGPVYSYFKIASAEDVLFRLQSGHDVKTTHYSTNDFGSFTPELLSVFFLAYVILYVREHIQNTIQRPVVTPGRGMLRRPKDEASTFRLSVQLGIPTEYSSHVSYLRRRKFETILILAYRLADEMKEVRQLQQRPWPELREIVAGYNNSLVANTRSTEDFEDVLNDVRLSVFPESASGLTFLVHTGKINPGYYASIDIGGGSSDLSFFQVKKKSAYKLSGIGINHAGLEQRLSALWWARRDRPFLLIPIRRLGPLVNCGER